MQASQRLRLLAGRGGAVQALAAGLNPAERPAAGLLRDFAAALAQRTGFSRGVAASAETAGTLGGLSDRHEALPMESTDCCRKANETVAHGEGKASKFLVNLTCSFSGAQNKGNVSTSRAP